MCVEGARDVVTGWGLCTKTCFGANRIEHLGSQNCAEKCYSFSHFLNCCSFKDEVFTTEVTVHSL